MDAGDNVKGIPGVGAKAKMFTEKTFVATAEYVIGQYVFKLGETKGVREFYKNYNSLKILETDDSFEIPEPTEIVGRIEPSKEGEFDWN